MTEDITQLSDKDKKEKTWMQVDGEKNFEKSNGEHVHTRTSCCE